MGNRVEVKCPVKNVCGGRSAAIHTAGKFHRTCGHPILNRSMEARERSISSRRVYGTIWNETVRYDCHMAPCVDDVAPLLSNAWARQDCRVIGMM